MADKEINIVRVRPEDASRLQAVSTKTFVETFASQNSEENIRNYMTGAFSETQLGMELHMDQSAFYFLKVDEQVIGYFKLNFGAAQTEFQEESAMEIERIYVLNQFHRSGFGQRMLNEAIDIAGGLKINYLWLGVWEKNAKAIAFYKKNNFFTTGSHLFMMGPESQTDLIMKKILA